MSTSTGSRTVSNDVEGEVDADAFRALALGGVLVLITSVVAVLQTVTSVVGGSRTLFALVIVMLAAATFLARSIDPRTATIGAVVVAVLGFGYYLNAAGLGYGVVFTATGRFVSDTVALATGLSLMRMVEAGIWTLGFAPGPVFLSWYLALRRRYVLSVVPGGVALLFLVLTGDATPLVTLTGTLGGLAAVGFGGLERRRGTIMQADVLAILFAAMIVLSTTVTLVPGGAVDPAFLFESEREGTLESSITTAPDRSEISGAVDLSPEVRFTVRSERPSYWRTGVYDRFTGGQWIRTGQESPYEDGIPSPPGETERVRQTVFVEDDVGTMPAAPHPVAVEGDAAANTLVTSQGQIRPDDPLIAGDVYNVESAVLNESPETLRNASSDYPEEIEERYLQTPESVSTAFEERTAEITGDADNPYDEAAAIESHLRSSKGYSLNVTRPSGNVADAFLLEMDEGYCVYFATTMVQMLRSEGIAARYVTGYTSGQQVDDNEWVVRGLNAHAWVEVYFPEHGWVAFDPTPGGPRDDAREDRIRQARDDGEAGVDTEGSEDVPLGESEVDETPFGDGPDGGNETNATNGSSGSIDGEFAPRNEGSSGSTNENDTRPVDGGLVGPDEQGNGTTPDDGGDEGFTWPSPEDAALGVAVLLGLAAGAHRTGATKRANRTVHMHWHGFRGSPRRDTERAYRRLELLLEQQYRPRRPSETPRQYLSALSAIGGIDPRAADVTNRYERAVYGGGVDREEADRAIELVDAMVRERTPVIGRF